MTFRRQFDLLPEDQKTLEEYGLPYETIVDKSQWVLIHDFPLPAGYNIDRATAAIRMETGYPKTQLNMVYFHPAISRRDGKPIGATNANQSIDDKTFQRWSRHRTQKNPWRTGFDNLGTHIILIEDWLTREFEK